MRAEEKALTGKFVRGIAGNGSLHLFKGSDGAILEAFNIALSLSVLVLKGSFGLMLLARRVQRARTGQVTDGLFNLSKGVLGLTGDLAADDDETNVSTDDDDTREGEGTAATNLDSEDIVGFGDVYEDGTITIEVGGSGRVW